MATTDATTLSGPNPTNEALEMKYLGVMTGDASEGAEISMGTANGGATTEISLRDFFAGGMSSISGNTYMEEDTTQTLTAVFTNAGDAFNAQVAAGNLTWTKSNNNLAFVGGGVGRTQVVLAEGEFPSSCEVTCTLTPSFNDHMTGEDLSKSITINITDSGS
jgi:hypothetical protein